MENWSRFLCRQSKRNDEGESSVNSRWSHFVAAGCSRWNREHRFFGHIANVWYNYYVIPQLSNDVQQYVTQLPEGAAQFKGADGTTFWVLTQDAMQVRQYVLEGVDEADLGETESWKGADEIKAVGRDLKHERAA